MSLLGAGGKPSLKLRYASLNGSCPKDARPIILREPFSNLCLPLLRGEQCGQAFWPQRLASSYDGAFFYWAASILSLRIGKPSLKLCPKKENRLLRSNPTKSGIRPRYL